MHFHPSAAEYILQEIQQLHEEGFDVRQLEPWADAARERPETLNHQSYRELLALAQGLPRQAEFAYIEPSCLAGIGRERPEGPRVLPLAFSDVVLADRIRGAWLGRTAGCMLGKPVEGWSRGDIRRLLEHAGAWPLDGYFPPVESLPEGMTFVSPSDPCLRGNITHGVRDDDMDYPLIGLACLEEAGGNLTSETVANTWLHRLPAGCVYTAERAAYRNLVNGISPPASGVFENPYREWIGAQIRADIWGWVSPGRPEQAARLAFRDACVSHVKNGIYGEMLFAAVLAAALAGDDVEEALWAGLSEIPRVSRLTEAITDVIEWSKTDDDWPATMDRVFSKYGRYHPVHTINNAAVVVCGLMHSRGDFGRAICIAVMGGIDTDCNGATAGSVMGALLGARALPAHWVDPLNDRLESIVVGMTSNRISDLAQRTLTLAKKL
ncbi:MAG TPA: ADP-ribosylglycohydrolase family protein [Armatimonadota bacterium]|nr:ADP-ribosylglycohydrolase family protein [Armatimonadota bacterium]